MKQFNPTSKKIDQEEVFIDETETILSPSQGDENKFLI